MKKEKTKSVEYYLSQGFDKKYAEYFSKERRKIVSVEPQDDYSLILLFDNNEKRKLDIKDSLKKGTVWEFLLDINNFKRVYLDEYHVISWDIDPTVDSNVVWNNKIDICPDVSYVESIPM